DGLKTGHTSEAGYGLVGSAVEDGRRLIAVISGLETQQARTIQSERLLRWGFRNFTIETLANQGTVVGRAETWIGEHASVPLYLVDDLEVVVPRAGQKRMKAKVVYDGPVAAPIETGDIIAELHVSVPGQQAIVAPLAAGEDVAKGGYLDRLKAGGILLMEQAKSALKAPPEGSGAAAAE
ncbi:MAG: D-alanyl-D-alanine carboxypeptidase, partial [Pseudomonadota bacterium]